MRAKMVVQKVEGAGSGSESVFFSAVTSTKSYGPNGENEDNTYARYTPYGICNLTINNPALLGQHKVGDKFYLTFEKADE